MVTKSHRVHGEVGFNLSRVIKSVTGYMAINVLLAKSSEVSLSVSLSLLLELHVKSVYEHFEQLAGQSPLLLKAARHYDVHELSGDKHTHNKGRYTHKQDSWQLA